jgi:hypothetical protein
MAEAAALVERRTGRTSSTSTSAARSRRSSSGTAGRAACATSAWSSHHPGGLGARSASRPRSRSGAAGARSSATRSRSRCAARTPVRARADAARAERAPDVRRAGPTGTRSRPSSRRWTFRSSGTATSRPARMRGACASTGLRRDHDRPRLARAPWIFAQARAALDGRPDTAPIRAWMSASDTVVEHARNAIAFERDERRRCASSASTSAGTRKGCPKARSCDEELFTRDIALAEAEAILDVYRAREARGRVRPHARSICWSRWPRASSSRPMRCARLHGCPSSRSPATGEARPFVRPSPGALRNGIPEVVLGEGKAAEQAVRSAAGSPTHGERRASSRAPTRMRAALTRRRFRGRSRIISRGPCTSPQRAGRSRPSRHGARCQRRHGGPAGGRRGRRDRRGLRATPWPA